VSSKSGNDNDDDDKDENTITRLEETSLENITATTTAIADQLDLGLPGAQKGGKKLAIVFTCTICNTRSAKQFTEKAYKYGVVMAMCPGCNNKHLIADNLSMFDDEKGGWSIEKAMAKMGQNVTTVTNDNVLELTLDQWVGEEKLQEVTDSIADEPKDNGKS
jgi:protein import protein ZIM17